MAIATACANIALVKYWGKRSESLNLPAAGSLSMTLEALRTRTRVEWLDAASDELVLDGLVQHGKPLERVSRFVDLVRAEVGSSKRVRIESRNSFPTAAGLASSASAFAALALATSKAFGLSLEPRSLSKLARCGSGSAARSVFGGFVRMYAGEQADGSDAFAEPMHGVRLELAAAVAVAEAPEKEIGSTDGMTHTKNTSPYHATWLALVPRDLEAATTALMAGDLEGLAGIVEGNCLAMHADAMAARPGIIYWKSATLWAIDAVRQLRREGTPVFFTIDAGPHVVAFTPPPFLETVAQKLSRGPGVKEVIVSRVGEGAQLEAEAEFEKDARLVKDGA